MANSRSLGTYGKTLRTLGLKPLANLFLYRLGLVSGHYRRVCDKSSPLPDISQVQPAWPLKLPDREAFLRVTDARRKEILGLAEKILCNRYPFFGGAEADIDLVSPVPLADWTDYETGKAGGEIADIKFIWELARFCWAVNLAEAYFLTGNEDFQEKFWELLEIFIGGNPAYRGPNWVSAQEAAIRIITVSFALSVFAPSGNFTPERKNRAVEFLILHARRIPITLPYSRAQNNNHLLLEGAGLYTAGSILPGFAESARWKTLGWKIIQDCLHEQIGADGEYCQHSLNYHRLMLQAALWAFSLASRQDEPFPEASVQKLRLATGWYLGMIDPVSGKAPNFGSNDGAWLLPLGSADFADQRPTAQAVSLAFLGAPFFSEGTWDDLACWLGISGSENKYPLPNPALSDSYHRIGCENDWAVIRAARYANRPFQADQLHVDLWHQGTNILLDAGTYSYNAAEPWANSLARTFVHNTATVDGMDQMTRAGRFLWLDWAQGGMLEQDETSCGVFHTGYKTLGALHIRRIKFLTPGQWSIEDTFSPEGENREHEIVLHWLLPDGQIRIQNGQLSMSLGDFKVRVESSLRSSSLAKPVSFQIIRAGKLLEGTGEAPEICGWYSPTYSQKVPAISLRATYHSLLPLAVQTQISIEPPISDQKRIYRCISS